MTATQESPAQNRVADNRLSVVIASWNGRDALAECLSSLGDDLSRPDTEIIVVTNYGDGVTQMLRSTYREVIHISMPPGTEVPKLRSTGVRRSVGSIVALAEDHCLFGERWCDNVRLAHQSEYAVVGGAVENATSSRPIDWAVFLHDYGRFMLPAAPGIVDSLAGNNVSYKRKALEAVGPALADGIVEPFLHGELKRLGYPLFFTPNAVVHHKKNYKTAAIINKSFHLARSFAATRVLGASASKRLLLASGSLALPVLLPLRIIASTVRKRRSAVPLIRTLPYIALLMLAWSAGEFTGYVAGEGKSGRHWS